MENKNKTNYISVDQRAQPNDPDTEKAVLGTMMRYNELYEDCADLLARDSFYNSRRKAVYSTICGVMGLGKLTDINSLADYARSNDVGEMLDREDFLEVLPYCSPSTFEQDVQRLNELRVRRNVWYQLQVAANKIQDYTEKPEDVMSTLSDVLTSIRESTVERSISTFDDAVSELDDIVRGNTLGQHRYLKTGFYVFDNFFLLRPDTLTIIAAFTSVGKSALALNIATQVAKQGIGVAYYSLEMGKAELASRAISGLAEVSSSKIMNTKMQGAELDNYRMAAAIERKLPIYIDERATVSFQKTIRSIRIMRKTKNIGLAIIDYLQIYNQTGDSTEAALAEMARQSKNVAKELQIPVIVLSQLNRSGEHPSKKMLRGSGQLEESADNIILIDRPEADPNSSLKYEGVLKEKSTHNTAAFILAKGRGVGNCTRLVGFNPKYTQFYDLDDNGNALQLRTPQPDDAEIPF